MTQSWAGIRSRGEPFRAGKAMKARKIAKARWIERVCVELRTGMMSPTMNGRGEAIQS